MSESLLVRLNNSSVNEKITALEEVEGVLSKQEFEKVLFLLQDSDEMLRLSALEVLAGSAMGRKSMLGPPLIDCLADDSELVRAGAAEILGEMVFTPALPFFVKLLKTDGDPIVRASVAEALGDLGDRKGLDVLLLALKDSEAIVRSYSANAIGLIGDDSVLPILAQKASEETVAEVLIEVIGAQLRLGELSAWEALMKMLKGVSSDLATNLLNLLDDLFYRKTPSFIGVEHLAQLSNHLDSLTNAFPFHRLGVANLKESIRDYPTHNLP